MFQNMIFTLLVVITNSILINFSHADSPWILQQSSSAIFPFSVFGRNLPTIDSNAYRTFYDSLMVLSKNDFLSPRLTDSVDVLIDGDWVGAPGFFSPDLIGPSGKQAILIRADVMLISSRIQSLLTHELTHLIHHKINPKDPPWTQEGIALLMEYLVTGFFDPVLKSGFISPESSLTEVIDPHLSETQFGERSSRAAQYGHLLQYFYYLYRNCGEKNLVEEFLNSSTDQNPEANSLVRFFKANEKNTNLPSFCHSFEFSFVSFEKARFLQNLLKPTEYVHFSSIKANVHEKQSLAPKELLPYSATAYFRKLETSCLKGEISLTQKLCLRYRLK